MGFLQGCRDFVLYFSALFGGSFDHNVSQQHLVPGSIQPSHSVDPYDDSPYFPAPNGPEKGDFICKYPDMGSEWTDCSTADDRSCWLKNSDGKRNFSISTNYEKYWPTGVLREYYLEVNHKTINGDGIPNFGGKVFNNTYPGPWIRACWGDKISITVKNNLQYNGTTIHWHGLRMLGTPEMDGVNGITQCPIAPNQTMTYNFTATQYGTSWAHSHYSLQYADGLVAPITIFGPSSSDYDEALDPILITDWNHRSAFEDWQRELTLKPSFPRMNSVLINGHGNFAGNFPEKKFNVTVTKGRKYLMRIINTSVDTTWIFSIDNHDFMVMSSDFVPITPYRTRNVTVGIGQRYHIVLNADPIANIGNGLSDTGDYWIRAIPADSCKGFETGNEPDERQGILRYNDTSTSVPTSSREPFNKKCKDEPYELLKPIFNWTVPPVKIDGTMDNYTVRKTNVSDRPVDKDMFLWWALGKDPMWLDFADPTILNLENTTWNNNSVVVTKDLTEDSWIYMVIKAPYIPNSKDFVPAAHPMHLHGHDFALLAQSDKLNDLATTPLNFANPPRRDVVLLPAKGFVVIAFKADNPGAWLLHCHIPWHASSGLALQIMERQTALRDLMTKDPEKLNQTKHVCAKWNEWYDVKENHWMNGDVPFQDDSGI